MSAKILTVLTLALISASAQTLTVAQVPALAQSPNYQPVADQPVPFSGGTPLNSSTTTSQGVPLRDVAPAALPPATPSTMAPSLVITTTEKVDGYHVRRYLGIARGVKVFQPTIGQNFKAGLRSIVGGAVSSYADMCEHARAEAFEQLQRRAADLGANAILGLRFDTAAFSVSGADIGTEVICYGTAVSLEADR